MGRLALKPKFTMNGQPFCVLWWHVGSRNSDQTIKSCSAERIWIKILLLLISCLKCFRNHILVDCLAVKLETLWICLRTSVCQTNSVSNPIQLKLSDSADQIWIKILLLHSVLFLASNVSSQPISAYFWALNWESSWPPDHHFVSCYEIQAHASHIELSNHAVQNTNQASVAAYLLASNVSRTTFRCTVWLQNVKVLAPHGCHFVFCFATALTKLRFNCQTRHG